MAKLSTNCLLLLFLSLLTACSSGTLVGFSYDARGRAAASPRNRTVSFFMLNRVSSSRIHVAVADHRILNSFHYSGMSLDLYLHESVVPHFINSKASAISWLKTHAVPFLPGVNTQSITLTGSNNLSRLLSTLKLIHSAIGVYHLESKLKVSVAFSLPFLEKLNITQERGLHRILRFIRSTGSFVTVEASAGADGGLGMGDLSLQSMIQRATLAASLLPCHDIPIVMVFRSAVVPNAKEADDFLDNVSKSLEKSRDGGQMAESYAVVSPPASSAEREFKMGRERSFSSSRRELQSIKTLLHDVINPPTTVLPTAPVSTPPTPTVVTVPASNPVAITPVSNPSATPLTAPSTNPSINPPAPSTDAVTTPTVTVPGAQPITNPVTTYPAPEGNVPVTTPVTNPVAPPATTNAPAIPGQSWCVAKGGALQTALQAALDYACGMGAADCSQIQQGGNCYNPNNLQNHASYAFNSYYQKNPSQSSCDFGGTATIVNVNPSTGSCIYPSSSSSASSLPTPPTSSTNPVTASPLPGSGASSTGTPPSVLNSSSPASGSTTVFGSEAPTGVDSSTSGSATEKPFASCYILLTSFAIGVIAFNM